MAREQQQQLADAARGVTVAFTRAGKAAGMLGHREVRVGALRPAISGATRMRSVRVTSWGHSQRAVN